MLSFFCAGTPGLSGGRAVLKALGTTPEETRAFRYRGNGWPGQATATLADGSTRSMSYHDSWGGILSRHVQHRCRICADGTGVAADLVCADAWESDAEGYPLFTEEAGTSLIVARTPEGAAILAAAVAAGRLETAAFDPKGLAAIQPGQRDRRHGLAGRLAALRLAGRPVPRYRGLGVGAAARQGGLRISLRNFTGMLRRLARPKSGPKPAP
jgi:coenzyme F420 hydrogenase subunit beta